MADQATLTVIVQDGGSASGQAPAPPRAAEPLRPAHGLRDNPDLDEAFGIRPQQAPHPSGPNPAPPQGSPPPRPASGPTPPASPPAESAPPPAQRHYPLVPYQPPPQGPRQGDWRFEAPPVRNPAQGWKYVLDTLLSGQLQPRMEGMAKEAIAPAQRAFGGLEGLVGALRNPLGAAQSGLASLGAAGTGVGLALTAVSAGLTGLSKIVDYNTKQIHAETNLRAALYGNNPYESARAEIDAERLGVGRRFTPFKYAIPILGGSVAENDKAKIEQTGKTRAAIRQDAARLAPYSAPIAAGQAQADVSTIQGNLQEGKILGGVYAQNIRLQAELEKNVRLANAQDKKTKADVQNWQLEMQNNLVAVAAHTKDTAKRNKIMEAYQESLTGNFIHLVDLNREMAADIRKVREEAERDARAHPLGALEDILRGGMMRLPARPDQDPAGQAGAAPIVPAFLK